MEPYPRPPQFLTPLRACEDRAVTLVVMRRTHREQTAMVGKCSEPKQRSFVLERRNAIAGHLRRLPRHSGPNRRIQWINMPGLTMKVADHVRWYLMATSNFELHAPHWHGNTVVSTCAPMSPPVDDGDACRGHGSRQSGYLAVPLSCRAAPARRDAGPLYN